MTSCIVLISNCISLNLCHILHRNKKLCEKEVVRLLLHDRESTSRLVISH